MGFFDRFFKKDVDVKNQEWQEPKKEFDLKDVEDFIKKEFDAKNRDVGDVSPIIEEIKNARDDAKEKVEALKNHEFPDEVKDRVYKPILTSKPQYVKSLLESLANMSLKEPENLDELEKSYNALLNSLKRTQKIQQKKGRIVAMAFEEEVMKLGGTLNRIIDLAGEIGEILEKRKAAQNTLLEIDSDIKELKISVGQLDGFKDKKATLTKRISDLEEEIKKMNDEKETLEKGDAFKKCMNLNECLSKNEEKRALQRSGALNMLGPLSRTFRKFKKVVDDGKIKFENRAMLERYIQDPARAFLSEPEGCPVIYEVIEGIEKAIERGTLSLSPKEKKKILSKIAGIKSGDLNGIKSRLKALEDEDEDIKKDLNSLDVQTACDCLEKNIEDNNQEIEKMTAELDSISKEEDVLERKIQRLKESIEEKVSKIDDTITLRLT